LVGTDELRTTTGHCRGSRPSGLRSFGQEVAAGERVFGLVGIEALEVFRQVRLCRWWPWCYGKVSGQRLWVAVGEVVFRSLGCWVPQRSCSCGPGRGVRWWKATLPFRERHQSAHCSELPVTSALLLLQVTRSEKRDEEPSQTQEDQP
jgi:hypothetical protein